MKLFAGSASQELAKKVSQILKIDLSQAEVIRFANSETKVRVKESVVNQVCAVIQSTANPTDTHLMELFFFCDALNRQEAKKVIAFIPYFGYARQNIQHLSGESVSVNVVIRFLESIGFAKVYTIDLHDEATEGVFAIPFKNLSALGILAEVIEKEYSKESSEIVVVSPDQGGIERARKFAYFLFKRDVEIAVIEKRRNLEKIHESQALALYGQVKGKVAILVDDILTSGKTLVNAANLCLTHGAKKVIAVVVHLDLSVDAPKLIESSAIEKIYTTDTIEIKKELKIDKFKTISVATLIAQELRNINSSPFSIIHFSKDR